jgi:N-6 DNA Methylase
MPTPTPTPRQHARTETERLVTNFQHQLAGHKLVSFNETQTRRDFLDPWLAALGWDTENRRKLPQPLREVHMEARVLVSGRVKFPDYEFRLDGQSRFFLEAKKPSVNLHDDWKPANQVRLYSWSAKLPVGVLTDFEELAIYDCRQQPAYQDLPSVGRLRYLTYDQYLDQFDTLYDLLGREAVAAGSLHALAATLPQQRGTQSVDKAFLATLEHMREQLAAALARHNRQLTVPELRFLVQALLDRIIFLRMAEDRGLEPYENLQRVLDSARLHGPDAPYQALIGRFREAQNRYNSGLFDLKADTLSAKVKLPETVLRPLLENLYYPRSPYQFAVMGADILGAAYERFLGKVIELPEPGRVVIEEKPAVRKAGGVYYTPDYIVRYLVKQALEPRCAGRTPAEVAQLRIVDPACGSGSFLLGAYDFLLEWHLRYYQANPKAAASYNPPATPRQPPGNPPCCRKGEFEIRPRLRPMAGLRPRFAKQYCSTTYLG